MTDRDVGSGGLRNSRFGAVRHRTDRAKNLVGFSVAGVRYAVDIQLVREIVNPLSVVHLPHVPAEMMGVADHRGAVLPVVDLRVRFGVESATPTRRTKWLIIRPTRRSTLAVALVVDAVTEVFGGSKQVQRELPELTEGDMERGVDTVYVHEGELVFVLDPSRVAGGALRLGPETLSLPPGAPAPGGKP